MYSTALQRCNVDPANQPSSTPSGPLFGGHTLLRSNAH